MFNGHFITLIVTQWLFKQHTVAQQLWYTRKCDKQMKKNITTILTARCYACAVLAIGLCLSQVGVLLKWL